MKDKYGGIFTDTNTFGATLLKLRKKNDWTQTVLARKLNVSEKTVSKWERGHGFPEVTQFPVIADLFGVTIDYLMTGRRRGITVAGTILADLVKTVDEYPKAGMLTTIRSVSRAVGGAVPNVAIDLAVLDRTLPVSVMGRVGNDEYGAFVRNEMQVHGINTEKLITSADTPTGFTDVMSKPAGERTFFNFRGTNDEFCPEDIDISSLSCKILHIGYIMLLGIFDKPDSEYGTVMARFLHDVQAHGIKTSVDVVSSSNADYKKMILPALKYCDYCIINEVECCGIWGEDPYKSDGTLDTDVLKDVMRRTANAGIREKLIVHAKSLGICYDVKTDTFTVVPSLKIPPEKIMGSTGAGDAFCAGCLLGIYNGMQDAQILKFAAGVAACNLFAQNSTDGMRDKTEVEKIIKMYEV